MDLSRFGSSLPGDSSKGYEGDHLSESESGDGEDWESVSETSDSGGSLFIPTPERCGMVVSPIDLPSNLGFIELPQIGKFLDVVNTIRSCTTPGCKGNLAPIGVKFRGLGGSFSVSFCCDGCALKGAILEAHSKGVGQLSNTNAVSMCVQVAFIIAGATHAVYYKTLKLALGIQAVSASVFMDTISSMYPVVKSMLDDICEAAKQEMRDKNDKELGSWKNAVTVADGTWQTRGWHSKNATFTIRNYMNGALLYYHHLCQKGRDEIIEEELYKGTSKSAEGYAARITFQRAKQEGMEVIVHWQDADSSSAKAFSEVYPDAEVMICGGHAGRAHKKVLEARQKIKQAPKQMLDRYKGNYPNLAGLTCKCLKSNHSESCGCLTAAFISKAHTNFTSILMEAQSQEEFVKRLLALPNHARDKHEWEGGMCDFHPLRVCTCKECHNPKQIQCEGVEYKTRMKLDCEFHALLYEIECMERAKLASKLVHPILKRGHSNAVEASHNVLIRFRSKDISLERLHYHVSTNLGLLQANLTYLHAKHGTNYHWIPELYQRMQLPIFEGIEEALETHSVQRKRGLDIAKTTPMKRRRVWYKKKRVCEGKDRIKWSKKHGHHTYFGGHKDSRDSDIELDSKCGSSDLAGKSNRKGKRGDCSKGKSAVSASSNRDCPLRAQSKRGSRTYRYVSESGDDNLSDDGCFSDASSESVIDECTCGAEGRAHKRGCPLSSRSARTLLPHFSNASGCGVSTPQSDSSCSVRSGEVKPQIDVGDYVCVHSRSMGKFHLPCRIVREFCGRYQLYCSKGLLKTCFPLTDLIPFDSGSPISLEKWRQAPHISLRDVASDETLVESCECPIPVGTDTIVISSASEEEESKAPASWVNNGAYSLSQDDRELILSRTGWLTDEIISAAQMLLLQFFPKIEGMQPPTLQKVFGFEVHCGEFIQIVHVRDNHWCVVSTVGCERGTVNVYDSLYSSVSDGTTHLIASMVYTTASYIVIRMMNVHKQSNGSDCGVLSIAYAFDICHGLDPCTVRFDHSKIRHHLVTCLENAQITRFPVLSERRGRSVMSTKIVELYCTCRMPEKPGEEEMARCDSCHVWYHRHCMDIPSEVFSGKDVYWECKVCVSNEC